MVTALAEDPAMEARVQGRYPMARLGDSVVDIGPVARFLLGPDAAFVTGNTLMADGGRARSADVADHLGLGVTSRDPAR